ncbi:hypothetical protein H4582DRAFT_2100471 [Lactarius indigo]|nr:hypothetical protein H4582DRAFT_2100471 [Lactarius indigo]
MAIGDTVKVVPGDNVPADGTIVRGSSSIDESAITGTRPGPRASWGFRDGAMVNGLDAFDMMTSEAPIEAFADRIAGYFVSTVISLAAIIVGMCIGAKNGIPTKGGGELEASHSLKRVVLDKTASRAKLCVRPSPSRPKRASALVVVCQVGIAPGGVWVGMSPKGKAAVVAELMEKDNGGVPMVGDRDQRLVCTRSGYCRHHAVVGDPRSVFSTIRRNLVWACVYNVLGIPLAMGLFLPFGLHLHPIMAGAVMAFGSVGVVTSSLLLKWWVRPPQSVMQDEAAELIGSEPLWMTVRGVAGGGGMLCVSGCALAGATRRWATRR